MPGRNISICLIIIILKIYLLTLDSRRRFALFPNFILVSISYSLQDSQNPADSLSCGSSFSHINTSACFIVLVEDSLVLTEWLKRI